MKSLSSVRSRARLAAAACLLGFAALSAAFSFSHSAQSAPAAAKPGRQAPSSEKKSTTDQPPAPDQLIARYIRALGGESALKKITSRFMKGKFEAPVAQLTGGAEILTAAPDLFFSRVTIADEGEFISAFDGKVGWSSDSRSGLREMQGQELESMRRSSQFQHELRFRQIFPQQRVLEKATEEGRAVWILEATPPSGAPEKFYFDAETGLLLRHDSLQLSPGSEVPIEHRYSDYAPVDGVQVPHTLRHKDPNVEWQVSFTEVRHNVPVDRSRFAEPPAQRP